MKNTTGRLGCYVAIGCLGLLAVASCGGDSTEPSDGGSSSDSGGSVSSDSGGSVSDTRGNTDQTNPDASVSDARSDSSEGNRETGGADDALSDLRSDVEIESATDAWMDVTQDVGVDGHPEDALVDGRRADEGADVLVDGGALMCGSTCPAGQKLCDYRCVDINDPTYGCDPVQCGRCGWAQFSTNTICAAGACAVGSCMPGRADCDHNFANGCEADLSNPATCGSCDHKCTPGQVCDDSTCGAVCPFGKTNCDGACHSLSSDPVACGTCRHSCDPGRGTAACNVGNCVVTCLPEATASCFGTQPLQGCDVAEQACGCDLPHSLMPCSPAYPEGRRCRNNQCVTWCEAGFSRCGAACVDEGTDPAHCGACGHACASGGICVSGECTTIAAMQIVANLGAPEGIAVDAHNVYYTDATANTVWQLDKVTLVPKLLASDQLRPWRVAVDSTHVYWASNLGGAILRTPIGTPGFQQLYSTNAATAVVVDDTNVYWSQADGTYAAPKGGGGVARKLFGSTFDVLDQTSARIFGANLDVVAMDKIGNTPETVFPSTVRLRAIGMAVGGESIFYTKFGQCSDTCTKELCRRDAGGGVTACDTIWDAPIGSMVAESCAAYWHSADGAIYTGNPGRTPPKALIRAAIHPRQLALDETYVYWVDDTWIGRVPKL